MSSAIKTLAALTVGTTAVTASSTSRKWASVSVQADPANSGQIFVGDNNVSATRYSRVLNAGDWFTISGSAVDPQRVWLVASAAGQIAHVSGS